MLNSMQTHPISVRVLQFAFEMCLYPSPWLCIQDPEAGSASALRHLICGGEALPPALAASVARVLPHAHLHNLYGPTEATVACIGESRPGQLRTFCLL